MGALHRLSARQIGSDLKPGRHADGGNLYLVVQPSGAKRWVFLYRWKGLGQAGIGRLREMGLGSLHAVDLPAARKRAAAARALLASGVDPIADKRAVAAAAAVGVPTFGELADEFVTQRSAAIRSDKSVLRIRRALDVYAAPLRPLEPQAVTTERVLEVLKPIWSEKAETAKNVRGYIEAVLAAATVLGHRTGENPARWKGHLDRLLPKRVQLTRGHHAALSFEEIPAFMTALKGREGVAAGALTFLILTAARSGEVLGATWAKVNLDAGIWTIPAGRMKAGKEHRVPLSPAAKAVLSSQREEEGHGGLIFPGAKLGRPLSGMAFEMLLRRMGRGEITTHGFRSSFRDWAGEKTAHAREVAEAALAHTVGDQAERAYRRHDALDKRRSLMDDWARFCLVERG